jgi:hypothetical protein
MGLSKYMLEVDRIALTHERQDARADGGQVRGSRAGAGGDR